MSAKLNLHAHCRGRCKHPPLQTPLWQKAAAILAWIGIWQFAAVGLGHGGLFLATPLQTLGALAALAPTAAFWQRIVFSALRILAGFLLAAAGGLLLGAAGARWHWVRVFIDPAMQLIRAMPVASFVILALLWVRSANLSVIVSFTHVLPVVYAGVLAGHRRHRHEAAGDGTGLPPARCPRGCGISGCRASSHPSVKAASRNGHVLEERRLC